VVHSDGDLGIVDGSDVAIVVVGCTKADEGEYVDAAGTLELVDRLFPPVDHPELGLTASSPPSGRAAHEPDRVMAPGGDRTTLRLSATDEALIAEVAATASRTIVCVMGGSAVVMPWVDTVDAVLMVWYPGMEGGGALGDVLTGAVEPGGRLPFAVPTDESHLAPFHRDADAVTYDLFHGQWLLDRDGHRPAYPFGSGSGYTTWRFDGAGVDAAATTVTVGVTNSGTRDGSTVVFVHAGIPDSRWDRPRRRLVGFAKVRATAGTAATIDVPIDLSLLDVRTADGWLRESGTIRLEIGQRVDDPDALVLQLLRAG
jgi:beta-glucosidase